MTNDLRLLMGGSFLSCAALTVALGCGLPDEWKSCGLLTFGVFLEVLRS